MQSSKISYKDVNSKFNQTVYSCSFKAKKAECVIICCHHCCLCSYSCFFFFFSPPTKSLSGCSLVLLVVTAAACNMLSPQTGVVALTTTFSLVG